ncbi:MAG TPA: hypothetical protein VEH76_10830 [Methylocystis sp.]|nr:hypothetical protein [Methylocystis sp.]
MCSAAPKPNLLKKFESIIVLSAFGILLVVASTHWCPGSLGLLSHTELFASFVRNDIATPDQVCLSEDLLIVYALYTIPGCWILRSAYQQITIDFQYVRKKRPDLGRAKSLAFSLFVFFSSIILLAEFIPDTGRLWHLDRAFEIKKFFSMMFVICGDIVVLGLVLAFLREQPDIKYPIAERPTLDELRARLETRSPVSLPESSAEAVRALRDGERD